MTDAIPVTSTFTVSVKTPDGRLLVSVPHDVLAAAFGPPQPVAGPAAWLQSHMEAVAQAAWLQARHDPAHRHVVLKAADLVALAPALRERGLPHAAAQR